MKKLVDTCRIALVQAGPVMFDKDATIEKACKEHNIEMQVIDCEEQEDLAAQYKIRNVPFAVLFNDNGEITFMGRAADLLPKIS